jgi:hypothetical protein
MVSREVNQTGSTTGNNMASLARGEKRANMDLATLLSQRGLVHSSSGLDKIAERAQARKASGTPMRILYGETFDDKGHSIDSLKYYLFVDLLSKVLSEKYGVKVEPTILVADLGVFRNEPDQMEKNRELAKARVAFANKAKEIYGCDYQVALLSEISQTPEFAAKLEKIREVTMGNEEMIKIIETTVPADRLEEERKRQYAYPFEEIAMILGYDIKMGPPREQLYDDTANLFLQHFKVDPLLAVYLTPSYPLGLEYGAYLGMPNMAAYGLTPYKVGSGKLAANRIAVGSTTPDEAKKLIMATPISRSPKKPNPLIDISIIAELAREHLKGEFGPIHTYENFYSGSQQLDREAIFKAVEEYILKKF